MISRYAALALFTANAEERTKTYEFKNITGIEAGFTYDIHVTHGRSNMVTIVYDSMYEDYMSVNYYGISGTLCLEMNELPRKLRNSSHPNIKVYLEMTKVEDIELSGASSITFEGEFSTTELDLDMSGASHLHSLKIKGTSLSADCSGASKAKVYASKHLKYDVSRTCKMTYYGDAELENISEDNNIVRGR